MSIVDRTSAADANEATDGISSLDCSGRKRLLHVRRVRTQKRHQRSSPSPRTSPVALTLKMVAAFEPISPPTVWYPSTSPDAWQFCTLPLFLPMSPPTMLPPWTVPDASQSCTSPLLSPMRPCYAGVGTHASRRGRHEYDAFAPAHEATDILVGERRIDLDSCLRELDAPAIQADEVRPPNGCRPLFQLR